MVLFCDSFGQPTRLLVNLARCRGIGEKWMSCAARRQKAKAEKANNYMRQLSDSKVIKPMEFGLIDSVNQTVNRIYNSVLPKGNQILVRYSTSFDEESSLSLISVDVTDVGVQFLLTISSGEVEPNWNFNSVLLSSFDQRPTVLPPG